jgi:DNA-binding response OmpR family regulator
VRLLIIERPTRFRAKLKRGLERQGFIVDAVADAENADEMARTLDYKMIVLNLELSNGHGLSVFQQWRRAGIRADVVVLIPPGQVETGVRCLDLGADDYLAMPFEPEELFARLRAVVRRRQPEKTAVLRIHDLEIDTDSRIVRRQGEYVHLTPREFALLELLARNQGRVVTRSMIRDHLYDDRGPKRSNIIDVYIRYLRAKIEYGMEPPMILTRWGEGYVLRAESA